MFPLPRLNFKSEQYEPIQAIVKAIHGEEAPALDLGKKVSTPQDLMMEELSLSVNRGSRLYQQRQKRVQRFVLENPTGHRVASSTTSGGSHPEYNGVETTKGWKSAHSTEGKENYQNDIHLMEVSGKRVPPQVPQKTGKVLRMSKALNPSAIAPGYSGPLKEVPPEKFNRTAIPKGYQSPWREFFCNADYQVDVKNHLPEPRKVNNLDLRNFNRTPTPFGGPLLIDGFPGFDVVVPPTDAMNDVMLLSNRPSFNRTPQGWIQVMPESEDL
ncbi:myozenin-3 [Crotalus tigris]|uniref:myozenin-3 n=1 Tax=Crotalus tigris TaxID=88082 RepID=UPI00192F89DD|nr:myozenin-3 [Crotalus tigris]